MIVKTAKEEYILNRNLSLITPKIFADKIQEIFKPLKEDLEKYHDSLLKPITIDEIKSRIANSRSLTFGVTQDCNLRCKYCVYGGKYKFRRKHNKSAMHKDIYKKAIDLYLDLVNLPTSTTRNDIVISFYGGEPLLEINNILDAYDYAIKKNLKSPIRRNIRGVINTNGVLLDTDKVEKLFERNFKIDISLDGPKDQHDMLRKKINNAGTFDDILSNITQLKKMHSEKYWGNIRFFLTIHPFHNIKRIEEFFISNEEFFNEKNLLIAWVDLKRIHDKYKKIWFESNIKQIEQTESELDKDNWFYKKMNSAWLEKLYINPTRNLSTNNNFTGTCLPGVDKFFITVDGTIQMCEKINSQFPIGHVNTGLDMDAISTIVNNWNKEIIKRKCWECNAWWICSFCYASMADDKEIHINEIECQLFKESIKKSFKIFLKILEREYETKNNNRYDNIVNYLESL